MFGRLVRALRRDCSGVAATELALSAPVLLVAGLYGTEMANLTITHMRINQLAVHIADNASRIGDTSTLQDRRIYESDINDLILGANIQAGAGLAVFERGRVIISSLEVDAETGKQYIHWQRCRGAKVADSSYGEQGDGLGATVLTGMGPAGQEVQAQPGDAVIFVEIQYDYRPLVSDGFVKNDTVNTFAAFTVRDDRDLSQIYQRDPSTPDQVQTCDVYRGTPTVTGDDVT